MCLATVYKNPENTVVCKNVSRIDVDGEFVLIRDIMGEEIRLQGKIKMVDLANSIVELDWEGVSDFQKGNMRLSLALTLVKEHLKEVK